MHFAPISLILMEPTPKDPKFHLVGRAGWRNRKTQPFSNCEFFFSNFHCNFKNFSTAKNQNQVIVWCYNDSWGLYDSPVLDWFSAHFWSQRVLFVSSVKRCRGLTLFDSSLELVQA